MRWSPALVLLAACATTQPAARLEPTPVKPVEAAPATPPLPKPLASLPPLKLVVLPTPGTPIVSLRLVFRAGAVDDPKGKEGLTALTTRLLVEGGTKTLSAAELNDALFPMAAELESDTDKELTVVAGRVHRERLERFLPIFAETVAAPRLDAKELERLKTEQLNVVRNRLRSENDEELGKVTLDALLYDGHPYRHANVGTESGLLAITLDDVRHQWRRCFTKARLIVGVAGAVDDALGTRVVSALGGLAAEGDLPLVIPAPPEVKNQTVIVRRDTKSTAGSFGFSWRTRRDDPDFPLVFLGLSYLGEHRQEHGVLFRELRDRRGLNYGTYAYAEHYRQDGWSSIPRPNIARTVQDLTLWLRPVEAKDGVFATRGVLYFLDETLNRPLPAERFETAKGFLTGATRIWTLTDQRRLGWAIDELVYGTPGHLDRVRAAIATATAEDVQRALKRVLDPAALNFVFVTKDAEGLRDALTSGAPSPISYATPRPAEVLEQDKAVERQPLPMTKDRLRLIEAKDVMR
ncbi:MAG: insulinase family protein [Myxococcaceae bacterium]|nr:insulinase family protein [Myxococcaceae bacterium]